MGEIYPKESSDKVSAKQIHRFGRGLGWLACLISFGQKRPFPIQIGPPMELVKKGVLRKSDSRRGMKQQRKKWWVDLLSGTWKTLFQHWRQFRPHFSRGAINRLDEGGRVFVTDTTPVSWGWGCLHAAAVSNFTPAILFPRASTGGWWQGGADAGGGNKGLGIGWVQLLPPGYHSWASWVSS